MSTPRVLIAPLAVLALALALGACGEQDGGSSAATDDPPTSTSATHTHATGSDDVVLSIDTSGGFVPVEYAFADQPEILVLGDGRVVVPDADQGTLMAGLSETRLDEAGLQQILTMADEAGLLAEPPSYEQTDGPIVSDAPTTSVVITSDGVTWTHTAYALGFDSAPPERARLAGFVEEVDAFLRQSPLTEVDIEAVRVRAEAIGDGPAGSSEVADWPSGAGDLATYGECGLVQGAAVDVVAQTLTATPSGSRFRHDGVTYAVTGAAVLPGEGEPCRDGGFS